MPAEKLGFTALPNAPSDMLLTMAKAHLSGVEHAVLDVVIRYTLGFQRPAHWMALSFIAKAADIHRNQAWRALDNLIEANIIGRTSRATRRLPAAYGIRPIDQWKIPIRPTKTVNVDGDSFRKTVNMEGDSFGANQAQCSVEGDSTITVEGDRLYSPEMTDCTLPGNQERKKENLKEKNKEKSALLKRFPEGTIVGSGKTSEPTTPLLEKSEDISERSQGAAPPAAPANPCSEADRGNQKKYDPAPAIQYFECELGQGNPMNVSLTKTEENEYDKTVKTYQNPALFQSDLMRAIEQAKTTGLIPATLRRPGDRFMYLVRNCGALARNGSGP